MTLHHDPKWPRAGDWPPASGHADVAIVGVPTHLTSLSATNAHETPAAVREALQRYSLDSSVSIVDVGDMFGPIDIDADLVIAIGGDNSATLPVAIGRWGEAIRTAGLVTVDAHHDLRDGASNGSPVRQLIEAGLGGERIVQIGIEPLANSAAYRQRAERLGITIVTRDELRRRPMEDVMAEALEYASMFGGPVHVDLDVDVCDRSVAPACPASVPGGISALELRTAARVAGAHPSVVSIDLVEVDATADAPDGRTVRLVALCILEAIAGYGSRPSSEARGSGLSRSHPRATLGGLGKLDPRGPR
jgi:formiminoglutamase